MVSLVVMAAIAHIGMFLFHLKERQIFCCFWLVLGLYLFSIAFYFEKFLAEFGQTVLVDGLTFYLTGSIALFTTYELLRRFGRFDGLKKKTDSVFERLSPFTEMTHSTNIYVALLFLSCVAFLSFAEAELQLNWNQRRQFATYGVIPFKLFTSLALVVFPASFWLFRCKRYFLFFLTILIGLLAVNLSGSRVITLALWGPAIFSVILSQRQLVKKILLIGLIAIGSVTTHVASRKLRQINLFQLPSTVANQNFEDVAQFMSANMGQSAANLGGESAVARYYFAFLQNQDRLENSYFKFDTLKRMVLFYLPRVGELKRVKPEDVPNRMWLDAVRLKFFDQPQVYEELMKSGFRGSVHATFWGDVYLNGRYIAMILYVIIFSALFLIFQNMIERMNGLSFLFFSALSFASMATIGRGSVFTGLSFVLWVFPLIMVLIYVPAILIARLKSPHPMISSSISRRVAGE